MTAAIASGTNDTPIISTLMRNRRGTGLLWLICDFISTDESACPCSPPPHAVPDARTKRVYGDAIQSHSRVFIAGQCRVRNVRLKSACTMNIADASFFSPFTARYCRLFDAALARYSPTIDSLLAHHWRGIRASLPAFIANNVCHSPPVDAHRHRFYPH
ncbi:hypothetical protein PSP6_60100 [Paraburkholderia tropica]|nr:hypothetical protein PSP6_60100 [Paraburkholderia tropica]